jgi:pimeloyl-ACP methyl ester carboxylesterase
MTSIHPPKSTLLLLPGLMCDTAAWQGQLDALSALANCQALGYGQLNSIGAMAEHVLAHAPTPRFALAGHSMGGRVALEIVRRAPERVERLALLDTGFHPLQPGAAGEAERAGRFELLALARREGMRAMGRQWARGMVHSDRLGTTVFDEILDMIDRSSPDTFAAQIQALLDRPDATDLLPRIACPTLLLCGRDDGWSPLARHEARSWW